MTILYNLYICPQFQEYKSPHTQHQDLLSCQEYLCGHKLGYWPGSVWPMGVLLLKQPFHGHAIAVAGNPFCCFASHCQWPCRQCHRQAVHSSHRRLRESSPLCWLCRWFLLQAFQPLPRLPELPLSSIRPVRRHARANSRRSSRSPDLAPNG